jgi:glycosyltransferase involved in cell wall biosynthesis
VRSPVTVAIPTLDAGPEFVETLRAVRTQVLDCDIELLICDSGSRDGTVALARSFDARVIEIPRESFSHGSTRNLLMSRALGEHVAFLTQDAIPAGTDWLAQLVGAFDMAMDVGLAFGPYRPRPDASPCVVRELTNWFDSFSDGGLRIDVLSPSQHDAPPRAFLGQLGFFTDANGCVARTAWERVPFRSVAYAEDHLLAQDMLRAGFAKVYVPAAVVIHSHEYTTMQSLRRSFDEARATQEVYGWVASGDLRSAARNLRGNVTADWRWACREASAAGRPPGAGAGLLASSLAHHGARTVGAMLGARSGRLPRSLAARLSLERRG